MVASTYMSVIQKCPVRSNSEEGLRVEDSVGAIPQPPRQRQSPPFMTGVTGVRRARIVGDGDANLDVS